MKAAVSRAVCLQMYESVHEESFHYINTHNYSFSYFSNTNDRENC